MKTRQFNRKSDLYKTSSKKQPLQKQNLFFGIRIIFFSKKTPFSSKKTFFVNKLFFFEKITLLKLCFYLRKKLPLKKTLEKKKP